MRMPPDTRRKLMLSSEGQILSMVGNIGADLAADTARSIVDGALNALIRIEGVEGAAGFTFALSDRIAGGLKISTPTFDAPAETDSTDEPDAMARDTPTVMYLVAVAIALGIGFVIGARWGA